MKVTPDEYAVRLVTGDYCSTSDAWRLAMASDFAAGAGYALGLRSPPDLAGHRASLRLVLCGEDLHEDGRQRRAARLAGYTWAVDRLSGRTADEEPAPGDGSTEVWRIASVHRRSDGVTTVTWGIRDPRIVGRARIVVRWPRQGKPEVLRYGRGVERVYLSDMRRAGLQA